MRVGEAITFTQPLDSSIDENEHCALEGRSISILKSPPRKRAYWPTLTKSINPSSCENKLSILPFGGLYITLNTCCSHFSDSISRSSEINEKHNKISQQRVFLTDISTTPPRLLSQLKNMSCSDSFEVPLVHFYTKFQLAGRCQTENWIPVKGHKVHLTCSTRNINSNEEKDRLLHLQDIKFVVIWFGFSSAKKAIIKKKEQLCKPGGIKIKHVTLI